MHARRAVILGILLITSCASPRQDKVDHERYLVLDSRVIERAEGARLVPGKVVKDRGNPLFVEDKPWEVRFDNLYPNVLYDERERVYRCWYSPFIIDRVTSETPRDKRAVTKYRPDADREMGLCYATSRDGLSWEKPSLGRVDLNGSRENNIVVRGAHGAGILDDPADPDPARRFKLFSSRDRHFALQTAVSPDGIRWSEPRSAREIEAHGDMHNNVLWVEERRAYVAFTRLWSEKDRIRKVVRSESPDFVRWTKGEVVLEGLAPHLQVYSLTVFRHAGVFLGLIALFDTKTDRVHGELAWSPDSLTWQRVAPGTPLIPSGPKGSVDEGCVYPAAHPVFLKDEIRLYYGATTGTHYAFLRDGALCLARLRPDGFAAYEPDREGGTATIVTLPLLCAGRTLRVNADAKGGSLRVSVLDPDGPEAVVQADVSEGAVPWRDGKDLAAFDGKKIRLKFELRSARLYSFAFTD